jgi:hypothetical protein
MPHTIVVLQHESGEKITAAVDNADLATVTLADIIEDYRRCRVV